MRRKMGRNRREHPVIRIQTVSCCQILQMREYHQVRQLKIPLMFDDCARFVSLSREASERYLRGETLETKIPDGWCVVGVEEFPLGLGKCVGGTVKNHCPKALRKR